MIKKYFISCALPCRKLGAIQIECEETEVQQKSKDMCPQPAYFRAYEVTDFNDKMPIDEFVPIDKMEELGY